MKPCFITSNNTTQKFILFFLTPSDKRLNRHQFTVACVRLSVALGFFGTHLADTLENFRCLWMWMWTNTQAQFVSYFMNHDTSISENAGLNMADQLFLNMVLQHEHCHRQIDDCCESKRSIQTLLNVIKYHSQILQIIYDAFQHLLLFLLLEILWLFSAPVEHKHLLFTSE